MTPMRTLNYSLLFQVLLLWGSAVGTIPLQGEEDTRVATFSVLGDGSGVNATTINMNADDASGVSNATTTTTSTSTAGPVGNTINIIPFDEEEIAGEGDEPPAAEPTQEVTAEVTPMPSSSVVNHPTNFHKGVPFHFTHIFFIAGDCTEPEGWYNQWSKAGLLTLESYVTEYFCAEQGDNQYSRDYQVKVLQLIEIKAGDQINETLVITLGMGLESDWSPVARLLRKGMAFFHGGYTSESLAINLTEYGLTESEVLYLYFALDEEQAAISAGREVCRLHGGRRDINIAKVYPSDRRDLDFRVDKAVEEFQAECPTTLVDVVWELQANSSLEESMSDYVTALRFNHLPDIIFTTQDSLADNVLKVANDVLQSDEVSRIVTTGWDHNRPTLLEEKKILTSVDQMVFHTNRGLWEKVKTILEIVQETGQNSTQSLEQALKLGNEHTVSSDTLLISSDKVGYLLDTLLNNGYDPQVPPNVNVNVSTGIFDTSVTTMAPFDGKFQAILWLKSSWRDSRLAWNPFVYSGTIEIAKDQIWSPQLTFLNQFSSEVLSESLATVSPDGWVTLEINYNSEFLCPTSQDLLSYPFDRYKCTIDIGAPNGVWLDQNHGFNVSEYDTHFETTWYCDTFHYKNTTVYYTLKFERLHFTAYVRLVIPAIAINMIGFISFWIDNIESSVGLGITGFLCALTFRETVEIPETAAVTWSEVFILVNLFYQAMVMVVLWMSYGHTLQHLTARFNKFCEWFDPRESVRETVRSRMKRKATTAAMSASTTVGLRRRKTGKDLENGLAGELEGFAAGEANDGATPSTKEMTNEMLVDHGQFESNEAESIEDFSRRPPSSAGALEQQSPNPQSRTTTKEQSTANIEVGEVSMKIERTQFGELRLSNLDVSETNRDAFDMTADTFTNKKNDEVLHVVVQQPSQDTPNNVDWIGRWIVVPSYIVILLTLLYGGWGFFKYDDDW